MVNKSTKNNRNSPSKFLRFTAIAFQMGSTIFLGNYLGKCLDLRFGKDFLEPTLTLISVFASMYLVISQVIKLSNKND